jgi:hypothetical protein
MRPLILLALQGLSAPAEAGDEMAFLALRSNTRHRLEVGTQVMPDFAC